MEMQTMTIILDSDDILRGPSKMPCMIAPQRSYPGHEDAIFFCHCDKVQFYIVPAWRSRKIGICEKNFAWAMYKIAMKIKEEQKEEQTRLEKREALLNGPRCVCLRPTDFICMDKHYCQCLECKLPCIFKSKEVKQDTLTIEMRKSRRVFSEDAVEIL